MWYKKTGETLSKGNSVHNKDYTLTPDSDRTQVIDGWKWFDTDEQAYQYHGLPLPEGKPDRRR